MSVWKASEAYYIERTPEAKYTNSIIIDRNGATIFMKKKQDANQTRNIRNKFVLTFKNIIPGMSKIDRKILHTYDSKTQTIQVTRFGLLNGMISAGAKNNKLRSGLAYYDVKGVVCKLSEGIVYKPHLVSNAQIRPNQKIVVGHIMKNIYADRYANVGAAGVLLKMKTGSGKSYVAVDIITKLQVKTLIIAHNRAKVDEWFRLCSKEFPTAKIGTLIGGKFVNGDIVVATIDSAGNFPVDGEITMYRSGYENLPKAERKKSYDALTWRKMFGLAIFDEAHLYTNNKASKMFCKWQCKYMLGLSATPEEHCKNFHKMVFHNVGIVLDAASIPGYDNNIATFTGQIEVVRYSAPKQHQTVIRNKHTGRICIASCIKELAKDLYRSRLIVDWILKLLSDNHRVIVFADRKTFLDILRDVLARMSADHAELIKILIDKRDANNYIEENKLTDENKNISIDASSPSPSIAISNDNLTGSKIVGGSKHQELKNAGNNALIVFTTYAFLGTGIDLPGFTAIVFATPRKAGIEQNIGRIFRGTYRLDQPRKIVDIVDCKRPCKRQYYTRKKIYENQEDNGRKLSIIESKISYNDIEPIAVDLSAVLDEEVEIAKEEEIVTDKLLHSVLERT
jgi:superfamily II DNA or RNA helicase